VTRPRFLADMNISPKTVGALQQRGWDIIRVSEVLPMDAADDEILEFARASRRVVVTQDLDFSALLVLKGYSYPSLITLRLASSAPEIITRRLLDVLPGMGAGLEKGNVYVVDDTTVRVRSLPIE